MRQRSDYPTFSDAEIQRRHKTVYGLMEQEGVDALLFTAAAVTLRTFTG